MEKRSDEWYVDRIRRRASREKIFNHHECSDFSLLDPGVKSAIWEALPFDLLPVLMLGSLDERWTVFGARGIYSVFDDQASLVRFGLPKGNPGSAVPVGEGAGKTSKGEAEWLLYGGERIWAPKQIYYSVWSLLKSIERSYAK